MEGVVVEAEEVQAHPREISLGEEAGSEPGRVRHVQELRREAFAPETFHDPAERIHLALRVRGLRLFAGGEMAEHTFHFDSGGALEKAQAIVELRHVEAEAVHAGVELEVNGAVAREGFQCFHQRAQHGERADHGSEAHRFEAAVEIAVVVLDSGEHVHRALHAAPAKLDAFFHVGHAEPMQTRVFGERIESERHARERMAVGIALHESDQRWLVCLAVSRAAFGSTLRQQREVPLKKGEVDFQRRLAHLPGTSRRGRMLPI